MVIEIEVVTKGRIFKKKTWWVYVKCDKCEGFIIVCNATKDPSMKMKEADLILCKGCSTKMVEAVEALSFKDTIKQLEARHRGFE